MPDPDPTADLSRKLARHGLPRRDIARILREMTDHLSDLEQEARAAGHTPDEARALARERLGDADELAKAVLASRRNAHWPGRHPFISFVCLPLPLFPLLFLGLVWLLAEASGVAAWSDSRHRLPEPNWAVVRVGFYGVLGLALAMTAGLTRWLALRFHCGWRWVLAGCGAIFLHAIFFNAGFAAPHGSGYGQLWIGYRFRWLNLPELIAWIVPLFALVLSCVRWRRTRWAKALN
jgi:hypothetical protein